MSSFKMDSDAKKKLDSYLRKHRGHSLSALNKMGMQVNPIVSNKIKIGRFIIEEMPQKMLKGSKGGNISTPTTPPGAIISAFGIANGSAPGAPVAAAGVPNYSPSPNPTSLAGRLSPDRTPSPKRRKTNRRPVNRKLTYNTPPPPGNSTGGSHVIHTGPKGGKYVVINGQKKYLAKK